MRVLLDTCVISHTNNEPRGSVVADTLATFDNDAQFLSVITIGEIAQGIALLDEGERKARLAVWLRTLKTEFRDRILSIDAETAAIWGEVSAQARRKGRTIGAADGLIAATALRHGLHVVTRNVADFEPTGVMTFNPWKTLSS